MRISRFGLVASACALALSGAGLAFADGNNNGPTDGAWGLQRSVTPVMDSIVAFNNQWLMPIMIGIVALVTILMLVIMVKFREKANPVPSKTSHNTGLEVAWTLIPVLILMVLAVPSMKLLYFQDVIQDEEMVIKVTADTWYWNYEYPDLENVEPIISNIVDIPHSEKRGADGVALTHAQIIERIDARPASEPRLDGRPYLSATDAPLVVPVDTKIAVYVTSNSNIHAFAVPQFGIKIDAVPGRINHTWFKVKTGEVGTYYGWCSEICGVNHAFMPIEVQVVSKADFKRWVANDGSFTAQFSDNQSGGTKTAAIK